MLESAYLYHFNKSGEVCEREDGMGFCQDLRNALPRHLELIVLRFIGLDTIPG